jgi:hypothetical protein
MAEQKPSGTDLVVLVWLLLVGLLLLPQRTHACTPEVLHNA